MKQIFLVQKYTSFHIIIYDMLFHEYNILRIAIE